MIEVKKTLAKTFIDKVDKKHIIIFGPRNFYD